MARSLRRRVYGYLPVAAQNALVSWEGARAFRKRLGAPFRAALAELERLDRADAATVREDQDRRLREIVTWAARTVPHYREQFARAAIDPATIRGVEDLPRLPPLPKSTVRERRDALLSEGVPARARVAARTSGTTGSGMALVLTREALGYEYAAAWRQRGWHGLRLGDRYAVFGGQIVVPLEQSRPPFWRFDRPRGRMLFSLYHMTPAHLDAYAEELGRPGYRFWQGYPSSIALLASHLLERGISLGAAAPGAVFTSSETLLPAQRERIEKATGARVADRYAHSELAVSASECPEGRLHLDTEMCAIEVDAHERGEGWMRGEVLATGFANRAMPLLRYRTGDVATLRTGARCPCGRERPWLEAVDGRIEDYVVTPDGRRIGRMDHVFKDALLVKEAQIRQPAPDRLRVLVVPHPGFDQEARRALEAEFRSRVGAAMRIEIESVAAIPREPNGKFRGVVSELRAGRLG
jgi:phenylacetate-CoA ligase